MDFVKATMYKGIALFPQDAIDQDVLQKHQITGLCDSGVMYVYDDWSSINVSDMVIIRNRVGEVQTIICNTQNGWICTSSLKPKYQSDDQGVNNSLFDGPYDIESSDRFIIPSGSHTREVIMNLERLGFESLEINKWRFRVPEGWQVITAPEWTIVRDKSRAPKILVRHFEEGNPGLTIW